MDYSLLLTTVVKEGIYNTTDSFITLKVQLVAIYETDTKLFLLVWKRINVGILLSLTLTFRICMDLLLNALTYNADAAGPNNTTESSVTLDHSLIQIHSHRVHPQRRVENVSTFTLEGPESLVRTAPGLHSVERQVFAAPVRSFRTSYAPNGCCGVSDTRESDVVSGAYLAWWSRECHLGQCSCNTWILIIRRSLLAELQLPESKVMTQQVQKITKIILRQVSAQSLGYVRSIIIQHLIRCSLAGRTIELNNGRMFAGQ